MTAALVREVSISRKEFLDDLPDVIGDRRFSVDADTISISDGDQKIIIELDEKTGSKSDASDPPLLHVGFRFSGMTDEEVRYFMQRYDSHKRLGAAAF